MIVLEILKWIGIIAIVDVIIGLDYEPGLEDTNMLAINRMKVRK